MNAMNASKTKNGNPGRSFHLLDDREVAAILGVSACTVRRLRYRGELPTIRIGAAARTLASAVADYIERQTVAR